MVTVHFLNHNASRGIRQKVPRWARWSRKSRYYNIGGVGSRRNGKKASRPRWKPWVREVTGKILECKEILLRRKKERESKGATNLRPAFGTSFSPHPSELSSHSTQPKSNIAHHLPTPTSDSRHEIFRGAKRKTPESRQ